MQKSNTTTRSAISYSEKRRSIEDAAARGDLEVVARLTLEILYLTKEGNKSAVKEFFCGGANRSTDLDEIRFHTHIAVVRENTSGMMTEQIPTGLAEAVPNPDGYKDALRLLAITEPLLDAAKSDSLGPAENGVDLSVLKRTIISVSQYAARITSQEPRFLQLQSPVYVLGDIHGNLADLQFFRKILWPAGPLLSAGSFLFLGDFVDRGRDSIAVVAYVMARKVLCPSRWHLLRGNHETREVNGNMEHYQDGSFLFQCIEMFGDAEGYAVWEAVNNFFDTLPLAASIDETIFCVHGGIPKELCIQGSSIQDINKIDCPLHSIERDGMVYQMLWSDPSSPEQEVDKLDVDGFGISARGCACFGERSLSTFLRLHRFRHVFRGHEAQQFGVGVSKQNKLTTIFSTSKDHFAAGISATCGCVLVHRGIIFPLVRALAESYIGLEPTYAAQSIEATDLIVAQGNTSYYTPLFSTRSTLDREEVVKAAANSVETQRSPIFVSENVFTSTSSIRRSEPYAHHEMLDVKKTASFFNADERTLDRKLRIEDLSASRSSTSSSVLLNSWPADFIISQQGDYTHHNGSNRPSASYENVLSTVDTVTIPTNQSSSSVRSIRSISERLQPDKFINI